MKEDRTKSSKISDSSNPGNKYPDKNRVPEQMEKKGINKKNRVEKTDEHSKKS